MGRITTFISLLIFLTSAHGQSLEPIVVNNSNLTSEGASPVVLKKDKSAVELHSITKADRRSVEQAVADMLNGNEPASGSGSTSPDKTAN